MVDAHHVSVVPAWGLDKQTFKILDARSDYEHSIAAPQALCHAGPLVVDGVNSMLAMRAPRGSKYFTINTY